MILHDLKRARIHTRTHRENVSGEQEPRMDHARVREDNIRAFRDDPCLEAS